jgi:HK97 gp10 family phage protein
MESGMAAGDRAGPLSAITGARKKRTNVEFQLKGFDQLERRLKALPDKIERKVMRTALRSTANKVKRRLAAGTPRGDPKPLNAYQRVKVSVKSTQKVATARISYKGRGTAHIMRIYERGSRRQPSRPFFQAAIAGYEQEAMQELRQALADAVEKEGG